MSALTRKPQNVNLLQPTKFILTFDRIPEVSYFCQQVNLPGVNLGQAPLNFPGGDVYAPGNKITYNPFAIRFILDEELKTWRGLHDWFRSVASPHGTDERNRLTAMQNYNKSKLSSYSDATLTVLSGLNNPSFRVRFTNIFPITLNDIGFDSTLSAEDVMTADATFVYDYFDFENA